MLELKTKWMTNTLAKESIQKNDFILCHNGARLFIVGYGVITSGGKNTYNYEVKDNEKNVVLSSGENAYLDALTKIILGSSPKAKANKDANKDTNESKPKQTKQVSKQGNKDSLLLTFDEAFEKACNMVESYKHVALMLGKYSEKDAINLALNLIKDAKVSEAQRIKDAKKKANIEALKRTLEIAIESQNNAMIEQIKQMIIIEESL